MNSLSPKTLISRMGPGGLVVLVIVLAFSFLVTVLVPGLELAGELVDSAAALKLVGEQQRNPTVIRAALESLRDRLSTRAYIQESEDQLRDAAMEFMRVDFGLPEKDDDTNPGQGLGKTHLDTIFSIAAERDKPLHIHADQYNSPAQRDTELILDTIEAYGYAGRVSLVHCISLAAQPKEYRDRSYARLAELGVTTICCPTSWIDSRRTETLAPSHNAITPVDEMLDAGALVAMGVDNIADIYKPFSDGDLWTEMRFLLEATHTYDIPALARIATTNGLRSLSLTNEQEQLKVA